MNRRTAPPRQRGIALLVMLTLLGMVGLFFVLGSLSRLSFQNERNSATSAVLAQAKEALIGYAASVAFSTGGCGANCPRPGELPCPDNWPLGSGNEGTPSSPCNSNAIGRLPWKTLGLPDLRDAAGERLWYAVSTRYKNNTRAFPLNSDTPGTISVRDANGTLLADASAGTGVAAVIVSPGAALTRQDGVNQVRSAATANNPVNYLDIANGEDNQNFADGTGNGFIQGPIKNAGGSIILNDTLVTLTRDDIMRVTEKRVAAEIANALLPLLGSLPNPAAFSDATCLGFAAIAANCNSGAGNRGRIPANPSPAWSGNAVFLNGLTNNHWFQQNAWREVIYYTTGSLTLNNPPATAFTGLNALVIMTGSALGSQARTTNAQKGLEADYLEEINLSPLDDTYTLRPVSASTPFNDKARCLPANPPLC
ncbi:MAG: hypothetical protein ACYC2R_01495 [Burkholderiales bacterium]